MNADVAVVGSGAGGAVAASELARAGIDTLLVEAGRHHDPAGFDQREDVMTTRLYEEAGQRFNHDQSILIMSGRGLGGSTIHNTALCVPPPRAVLESWHASGALPAAPVEVERTAQEVLARIGARPPEPELVNRSNRLLAEGARALDLETTVPLTSRVSCSGCGYCILGCAYNRKRHVLFSHLEEACARGLRILTQSPVRRIRRLPDGRFELDCPPHAVRCKRVVLAASALGTPVLLQRSGLGGAHVGRNLRLHPFAPVAGIFDEPVDAHRGVPQSVLVTGTARFLRGGEGGSILMAGAAGPAGTSAFVRGPSSLAPRVLRSYRHLAVAGVLLHDRSAGRVRARRDGLPDVRYWPVAADAREIVEGVRTCARIHLAAGARSVLLPFRSLPIIEREEQLAALAAVRFRPHDVVLTSVHPQGTARVGRHAREAATDPMGRLFAAPHIRIADGSLFPTSVGVPPQITIMALATLIARDLAAELT